jgi:hypothetical protein
MDDLTATQRQRRSMKEMPAEFFLPPQSNEDLWSETVRLLALSVGFIVFLAVVVALTNGIVIKV